MTLVLALWMPVVKHHAPELHQPVKDTYIYILGNNGKNYYLSYTEPAGYQLEMIRSFSKAHYCTYRIEQLPSWDDRQAALLSNAADIIVCSRNEWRQYQTDDRLVAGIVFPDSSAWVVRRDNMALTNTLGHWIARFRQTTGYRAIQQKYLTTTSKDRAHAPSPTLSPYDGLIKKYAQKIDWDWRLLAALICQESRFDPTTESPKGAYGLMQVMPQTAESFGIDSLENPEHNIEAGSELIRYLTKYLKLDSVDTPNKLKFILAAYNAGIGRINDCRTFATSMDKDPNNWDEVAAVIPLMRQKIHYTGEAVQLGRFKGNETLNFVHNVWERYEHYQNLVAE